MGGYGSESDGGIFKRSNLGICLENKSIQIPEPTLTCNSRAGAAIPIPFTFLGDAAFPLKNYLMIPYSGQQLDEYQYKYNKEQAKGRVTIENAFGVLAARWQIYHSTITAEPTTVDAIIKCTAVLHNFLTDEGSKYMNKTYVDQEVNDVVVPGQWRKEIPVGGTIFQPLLPQEFQQEHTAVRTRDEIKRILSFGKKTRCCVRIINLTESIF